MIGEMKPSNTGRRLEEDDGALEEDKDCFGDGTGVCPEIEEE